MGQNYKRVEELAARAFRAGRERCNSLLQPLKAAYSSAPSNSSGVGIPLGGQTTMIPCCTSGRQSDGFAFLTANSVRHAGSPPASAENAPARRRASISFRAMSLLLCLASRTCR